MKSATAYPQPCQALTSSHLEPARSSPSIHPSLAAPASMSLTARSTTSQPQPTVLVLVLKSGLPSLAVTLQRSSSRKAASTTQSAMRSMSTLPMQAAPPAPRWSSQSPKSTKTPRPLARTSPSPQTSQPSSDQPEVPHLPIRDSSARTRTTEYQGPPGLFFLCLSATTSTRSGSRSARTAIGSTASVGSARPADAS